MANPLYNWHLTISMSGTDGSPYMTLEEVKAMLIKWCKKWEFQGEISKPTEAHPDGYKHWQCSFSLIKKKRLSELKEVMTGHLSPTSNKGKQFKYCLKEDTRIPGIGPYTDEKPDGPPVMPWNLEVKLHPWQQEIYDKCKIPCKEARIINVLIDEEGCKGKSTLCRKILWDKHGTFVPKMETAKDMSNFIASSTSSRYCFMVDIPRMTDPKKMNAIWDAVEQIKDGLVWDWRYKSKVIQFPPPHVWVFLNHKPDFGNRGTSINRWKFWNVNNQNNLIEVEI
nr:MAG: replication associated protein [Cressdnaviricota sp.]